MADTLTSNYQWTKPQVGAAAGTWGASLNGTIDGIDNVMNACRAGSAGAYSGNRYNINWANGVAELWIDTSNEGTILTSYGGTITGSLTVNGDITSGGHLASTRWVGGLSGARRRECQFRYGRQRRHIEGCRLLERRRQFGLDG